jgi:hypothetical protein
VRVSYCRGRGSARSTRARPCLSRFRVAFAKLRRFRCLCLQVFGVDGGAVVPEYREFGGQRTEHTVDERPLRVQARFERDDVQRDDALRGPRRHRVARRPEDRVNDRIGVRGTADRQRPRERFGRVEPRFAESRVDTDVNAEGRLAVESAEGVDRERFAFGCVPAGELLARREFFRRFVAWFATVVSR